MSFFRREKQALTLESALDALLSRTKTLLSAVEPDSAKIGYIAAGLIGTKVKSVRQALDQTTTVIESTAKDNGGELSEEHIRRVHTFMQEEMLSPIETILHRCSVVHRQRFQELSVSGVVEIALGWFVTSFDALHKTFEASITDAQLLSAVKVTDVRIADACKEALRLHKNGGDDGEKV